VGEPGPQTRTEGLRGLHALGPLAALEAIERATGEKKVNFIGYCLGGTLLGCALAWLAARGEERVGSATFFVSLLDFRSPAIWACSSTRHRCRASSGA
jgi:polyhydroxyalkanoate synthase